MASNPEDGVDLISKMPDDMLLLILSRLSSTEEVIRSSILSRRWRYVWTGIPSLDLEIGYDQSSKTSEFKEVLDWVLANRTVDLDFFRLDCFGHYSMPTVSRWIHAALTKNVKHLDLRFWSVRTAEVFEMPHHLVNCGSLKVLKLHLQARNLRLPNTLGFPALRVLHLTCVKLVGGEVNGFLERCPLLADLTLLHCFISKLDLLCISCPKLQKLSITNLKYDSYDGAVFAGIKICCPKLVDSELRCLTADDIFFELEGNTKSVLFPGISSVEYLSIDLSIFSQCIDAALYPALTNLKNLVLRTSTIDFTMDIFNRILNISPKLESLKLMIIQKYDRKYQFFDKEKTRRMISRVEAFEFNGEKPRLDTRWFFNMLKMRFSWGNECSSFSW